MTLDDQARAILLSNDKGGYTVPNPKLYPFQWNWDSCLVALGFATFDEPRAWQEIEMLFSGQWADGMLPHIVYHVDSPDYAPGPAMWDVKNDTGVKTSGITQPPVAAICVRKLYEGANDKALAEENLRELFPKLFAWHKWFYETRDMDGTGLVAIYHPWESGRDNCPDWDLPLSRVSIDEMVPYQRKDTSHVDASERPTNYDYDRYMTLVQYFCKNNYDHQTLHEESPFRVADTTINFILSRATSDLIWIAKTLGETEHAEAIAQLEFWLSRAEKAQQQLWNDKEEAYQCLDLTTGELISTISSGSFLYLLNGAERQEQKDILIKRLSAWRERSKTLVTSFNPFHEDYDHRRYWRGPIWAVVNFLIYEGLITCEDYELADIVTEDTARMISTGGFAEYFCPETGEGLGGQDFSWTASMWLCWLSPECGSHRAYKK